MALATLKPPIADRAAVWLFKTFGSGRASTSRSPWDFGTLGTKADPVGGLIVSSYGLSQPVRTPRRFDKLADEGYTQNPPVYRAINIISTAVAGIPWQLFERKGSSAVKRRYIAYKGHTQHGAQLDKHPLLDLMQKPNPTQGWGKFVEAYTSYLYVAGNSYVWANLPNKSATQPVELWTMRPDRMRVIPDDKQFVAGYSYEVNGKAVTFNAPSVLHTKTFAPLDDWYGMSPLVVAARNIDIRNAGGDWNLALLQNSGRVPGFFVSKERMGDSQFERMREQLIDRYTGARNVGLPGLLEDGVTWVETGMKPTDADWMNLSADQSRDIAMTLGVPAELLGDNRAKTFSNYQEARASLYTETVLPLMDMIRDELNRWLVPMYGEGLTLDYDREDIEALQEERGRLYQWVGKASFLTINEQRDILGYPPRPEGDVIVVPLTMAGLDTVADGTQVHLTPPSVPLGGGGTLQPPKPGGRANDANTQDEGAPTPAPGQGDDAKPGGTGAPDGGMGSATEGGAKSSTYDPLDDILAGKVVNLEAYRPRPKAKPPAGGRSPYRRLTRTGTR